MNYFIYINSLIAGLLLGIYAAKLSSINITLVLLMALLVVLVAVKLPKVIPVIFILSGVVLGMWRSQPIIDGYSTLDTKIGQKVLLEATVITDPVYHLSGQYELNANNLRLEKQTIKAEIRIRSYTNDVRRGDRIRVEGKLRDGFASWQASMYYAELDIMSRDDSKLTAFRDSFIASTYSSIPDPEASLGLGFLMGIRTLLPDELEDQLSVTGLTHIVAVSGYNLTILALTSKRLFHRSSRFQAAAFTLALVFSFVAITGWSPSIMRAVIVSVLSIGAWFYGRNASPWVLLLYSSSLSAFINPAYAWFSIGWSLSLAAFFGVLVVAPAAKSLILGTRNQGFISQIFFETSAAQLVTMPIILLVFHEVSVIALISNLIILPMIPISMLATFLVGITYAVNIQLAGIFAYFSYIILNYITSVINILSSLDWAVLGVSINTVQLVVVYGLIIGFYLLTRRKLNSRLL